jgi:lambda repressor-like predicted transcriptional regulator
MKNDQPLQIQTRRKKTMRKQRVWTPELQKRRVLFATLQGLGISLDDLAAKSGLAPSTFSKALWGEHPADQTSKTLQIVEKAIAQAQKAQEKKSRARKPASRNFN